MANLNKKGITVELKGMKEWSEKFDIFVEKVIEVQEMAKDLTTMTLDVETNHQSES